LVSNVCSKTGGVGTPPGQPALLHSSILTEKNPPPRPMVGDHYWISDRSDLVACAFADQNGIKRIQYSSKDNHKELELMLDDLRNRKFQVPEAEVVVPTGKRRRNFVKPPVEALIAIQDSNHLRIQLNAIATQILQSGGQNRMSEYDEFVNQYEMPISRAWFIPRSNKAQFFDYTLTRLISGDGAFGRVCEARDAGGKPCAVKIIRPEVHDNPAMLEAFRRGVASMRIVSKRGVPGVVAIKDAWEMPASIVMDFVNGLNLEQIVVDHMICNWRQRLLVFRSLANVLLRAHRLPEVVVHRDVRPPNIILEGLYSKDDEFEVRLVDFDLSWHRDAMGQSIQHQSAIHGYFAPEQYATNRQATSGGGFFSVKMLE